MDLLHEMQRMESIRLAGTRRSATLVHSADCSGLAQDYGATGASGFVGGMSDTYAGDICDSIQEFHFCTAILSE
jgi:hypothetical protein